MKNPEARCKGRGYVFYEEPTSFYLHNNPMFHHNHPSNPLAEAEANFHRDMRKEAEKNNTTCGKAYSNLIVQP